MNDLFNAAIQDVIKRRAQIIEEYLRFWLAAQVPDDYLTPEWVADNLVLIQQQDGAGYKFWVEFKDKEKA